MGYCGGVQTMNATNETKMNETIHILAINGTHCKSTRAEFMAGIAKMGASAKFMKSRLGDFEVIKVNGQAVAMAFATEVALFAYFAERAQQ